MPEINFSGLEKAFRDFATQKKSQVSLPELRNIEKLLTDVFNGLQQPDNSEVLDVFPKRVYTRAFMVRSAEVQLTDARNS